MNEDTAKRTEPTGRSIRIFAVGDNISGLELDALDEARKFFGPDVRLEIEPSYQALRALENSTIPKVRESGKRYHADVTVRIVES